MATRFSPCSSLPFLPSQKVSPRNATLVMMCLKNHHISVNLQIRSYCDHKIKVFEDHSTGIVCYKDENGEMVCEGYDEGPRFYQPYTTCNTSYPGRGDEEIIELLQRCLLRVAGEDDDQFNDVDVGTNSCNGSSNKLY